MTPEELTRLKELNESAYQQPLKVRTGYMAGNIDTVDITTEDYAYPPFARLWANPHAGYWQMPPHDAVVEKLVGSYNALPALLAEIERLQERERILAARLARVNEIAPVTYQLALSAGQGVGA